jgi:hypothetical protein
VDGDVRQAELSDRVLEPRSPPGQRLDEVHLEVRPGDGDGDPRQARSRPDVHQSLPRDTRYQSLDDGAVEDVALPQARRLPRPDQPMADARVGEELDEPNRDREPVPEHPEGRCRGLRYDNRLVHGCSLLLIDLFRADPSR